MENRIKIALCLSGEPRNTMASFPYIYESFLKHNNLYKTDTYLHSWKGFRALEMYNPKKFHIDSNLHETNLFVNYFYKLNLSGSIKTQLSDFESTTKTSYKLRNTFLMFYSFNKCFNLIEDSYDLFIKCRYDTFFENKFYIDSIIVDILENKYDMFIPYTSPNISKRLKLDDAVAIGNYKSFKAYSDTILDLNNLLNQTQTLDPHTLLSTQLNNNNIKISQNYISSNIIRKNNIIVDDKNFIFNNE
jgi:hypothetical protein